VGKLTVGRLVAEQLGGRLLDSHTIYNVAFRLTEFKSEEFYATVRAVRDIAFHRVAEIPASVPIILTNAYADTDWGNENWDAVIELARRRKSQLYVVVLDCSLEENLRRVQAAEREYLGKLRDPDKLAKSRNGRTLLDRDADHLLYIDNSSLDPAACAQRIVDWIKDSPRS
jgi:hypothetical protein